MQLDRRLLTVERVVAPILVVGLLALAVLQYHWLDQWAVREAESRQAALQTLAKGIAARIDAAIDRDLSDLRGLDSDEGVLDLSAPQEVSTDATRTPLQVLWISADLTGPGRPIWRLDHNLSRFVQIGYAELAQEIGSALQYQQGPLAADFSVASAPLLALARNARAAPSRPSVPGYLVARLPEQRLQAIMQDLQNNISDGDYSVIADLHQASQSDGLLVPSPSIHSAQPAAGYWRLKLRYRAGSADQLAALLQRRNLAVAAVVLLLLTASSTLLWIAARSRRLLAEQRLTMVATVSHELRTPLAVIDSAAANLVDGITTNPSSVVKYGQLIRDQSQRLRHLVEHALAPGVLTQSHQSDSSSRAANAALAPAVARSLEKLSELQARQRLRCDGPMPVVAVDAMDLDLMLSNLIANALRYSGPGSLVRLHTQARRHWLLLTVSNDCSGLPGNERKRLLEPFFRGQRARGVHPSGSGLGLNLIQAISRRYRGDLRYRICADEILFELRLPLGAAQPPMRA